MSITSLQFCAMHLYFFKLTPILLRKFHICNALPLYFDRETCYASCYINILKTQSTIANTDG